MHVTGQGYQIYVCAFVAWAFVLADLTVLSPVLLWFDVCSSFFRFFSVMGCPQSTGNVWYTHVQLACQLRKSWGRHNMHLTPTWFTLQHYCKLASMLIMYVDMSYSWVVMSLVTSFGLTFSLVCAPNMLDSVSMLLNISWSYLHFFFVLTHATIIWTAVPWVFVFYCVVIRGAHMWSCMFVPTLLSLSLYIYIHIWV